MAAIRFKTALGVERRYENGFGGIDRSPEGRRRAGLFSAENLEVLSDGSLASRVGYRQVREFGGEFRGYYSVGDQFYSVIGNALTVTDTKSDSVTSLGFLPTFSGHAEIFRFDGDLFVHDGKKLYRHDGGSLSEVEGYAPLYGMNWDPEYGGTVNEDINLLSDRIMVSYTVSQSTNSFYLGIRAASVDRVTVNRVEKDARSFTLTTDENGDQVILADSTVSQSEIFFWLTLAPEESRRSTLAVPLRAFVFGKGGRICFYSPGRSGVLYCSKPVNYYMLGYSSMTAENEYPLYFAQSTALSVGDGTHPISGMAAHYGRALLFTEYDTWCVDFEGNEKNPDYLTPKIFRLNTAIGSLIQSDPAYCENDPLTYFCGTLWRWHSHSGVTDECSASVITTADSGILPAEAEEIELISLPHKQAVYISYPADTEGRIAVYNTRLGTWTVYKDIFAQRLVRYGRKLGFIRPYALCVFDTYGNEDAEFDSSFAIKASFSTNSLDFGVPERTKRSIDMILSAELGEKGGEAIFENERGEVTSIPLAGGDRIISERITLPRFKRISFTLKAEAPAICRSLILSAK